MAIKIVKVIFLDIDGVLQSPRYCEAIGEAGQLAAFEPAALHMLQQLVEQSGAKIVISSTWRYHTFKTVSMAATVFSALGFSAISRALHTDWRTPYIAKQPRGMEIQTWLDEHPDIERYVILDDIPDMLESQSSAFVQTCSRNGLLLEHYLKARKILGLTNGN